MNPIAAKQMATKAKIGPPVVEKNIPAAAINSAVATHACWCLYLPARAANEYMAMIEISQGMEL